MDLLSPILELRSPSSVPLDNSQGAIRPACLREAPTVSLSLPASLARDSSSIPEHKASLCIPLTPFLSSPTRAPCPSANHPGDGGPSSRIISPSQDPYMNANFQGNLAEECNMFPGAMCWDLFILGSHDSTSTDSSPSGQVAARPRGDAHLLQLLGRIFPEK